MPNVVSVRLRHPGQFYDFDVCDLQLRPGDCVIVDTARGQDIGQVVAAPREVAPGDVPGELKAVVRLANEGDFRKMERFREKEIEVLARVQEKIAAAEIPMRLVSAEYSYNGRSLTIYFSAEQRVDFRDLVKELAREFRTRIELRQIGARDEARLLGGIGTCGRELCCATWLQEFLRISVRMAKDQDLPLSPMKISGVCGRLLCCLSYECDQYRAIKAYLPALGEEVVTLRGRGRVVAVSVPKESATVEIRQGLTIEVPVRELTEATQLEAEGRLQAMQPGMFPICMEPEVSAEVPVGSDRPAPEAGGDRSRRRRRKKPAGGAGPRQGQPPARPKGPGRPPAREEGAPPRPDARRRRGERPAGERGQPRPDGRPAAPPKRAPDAAAGRPEPSAARRRRPRRRRPPDDSRQTPAS